MMVRFRNRVNSSHSSLLFLVAFCYAFFATVSALECVDDDVGLAKLAGANSYTVNGCVDAIDFCEEDSVQGNVVRSFCCEMCGSDGSINEDTFRCIDVQDKAIDQLSKRWDPINGIEGGCSAVGQSEVDICGSDTRFGRLARGLCCATCSDKDTTVPFLPPVPDNSLPPSDKPLQVFLLGGQSECVGGASSADLFNDEETYPELQGTIDGVWFAGFHGSPDPDRFFINRLSADVDRKNFGPEVSFGERIYSASGGSFNVMMVKYCVGGTTVRTHWNPETPENSWDTKDDDGTAEWLESNANVRFSPKKESKSHLFVNMVYTIRRTEEALKEAGIPYGWAGIVWVQGQGDDDPDDADLWKTFGENTARVWNGLRRELGKGSSASVPIVDTGSASKNQLKSGKEYATQIVDGCQSISVEFAMAASSDDDPNPTCRVSATDPCLEATDRYGNIEVYEHYGYDPNMPEELISPDDYKEFHWWVQFPTNLHSAYEGMILKGRMLANAYVRAFSTDADPYNLGRFDDDVAVRFPSEKCPNGVLPSEGNFCWIDYRRIENSVEDEELCSPINSNYTDSKELSAAAPAAAKTISILWNSFLIMAMMYAV